HNNFSPDLSSDVCSSDLPYARKPNIQHASGTRTVREMVEHRQGKGRRRCALSPKRQGLSRASATLYFQLSVGYPYDSHNILSVATPLILYQPNISGNINVTISA